MMEKKIVLINGASSGIGEGCARKFAMNGYRRILNGRNVEKLNAVKKELLEKYGADEMCIRDSLLAVDDYSVQLCVAGCQLRVSVEGGKSAGQDNVSHVPGDKRSGRYGIAGWGSGHVLHGV